jgi:putative NADPH-quinone reductase
MNVLVVFSHAESNSFNGALFKTSVDAFRSAGHEVKTSDLYSMEYDPVSDRRNFTTIRDAKYFSQQREEAHATRNDGFTPSLDAEIAKIKRYDLMIWQFPLWWFGVPGILKGWIDRSFPVGRTYGGGRAFETGQFNGKRALLSLATGANEDPWAGGVLGDIDRALWPIQFGILGFLGFQVLKPNVVFGPARMSDAQRARSLSLSVATGHARRRNTDQAIRW